MPTGTGITLVWGRLKNKIAWRIIIQPLVVITSCGMNTDTLVNAIPCLCSPIYHSIWCQLWVKHAIRVHCPINKSVLSLAWLVGVNHSHYHSFRNTWFHSLWGVHDFTHSLYIQYGVCQYMDYVYGLMTDLFACISPTSLSLTYYGHYIFYLTNEQLSHGWSNLKIFCCDGHYHHFMLVCIQGFMLIRNLTGPCTECSVSCLLWLRCYPWQLYMAPDIFDLRLFCLLQ